MEKCWFVLRQKHYPPPQQGVGPIQLGHLIADLKHLDQVINYEGPHPFPRAMAVYFSVLEDLRWQFKNGTGLDFNASVSLPIPQAASLVSAGGHAGVMFRNTVTNFWQFGRLDSQIFQPTTAYIKDALKNSLVQDYIEQKKSVLNTWSLFMITGLAIAKSAKGRETQEKEWRVQGGPDVSVTGLVDGRLDLGISNPDAAGSAFANSSDFIWAVRLSKISKHLFASDLAHATYFRGATYSAEAEQDVNRMLLEEGIRADHIHFVDEIEDEEQEERVFVLPAEEE